MKKLVVALILIGILIGFLFFSFVLDTNEPEITVEGCLKACEKACDHHNYTNKRLKCEALCNQQFECNISAEGESE